MTPTNIEQLIETIVDRRVEVRLRALGVLLAGYTTNPSNPALPRDVRQGPAGRRYCNEKCRAGQVPDAEQDGRGWKFSAEAWRMFRTATSKKRKPDAAQVVTDDEREAQAMVRGAVRRSA